MTKRIWESIQGEEIPESILRYRTLSVEHLEELQSDFEALDSANKISNNAVFRSYIDGMKHKIPDSFPDATSIVVMAIFCPLMMVDFHYGGTKHEILLPHYYDLGITEGQLQNTILDSIIGERNYRVENARLHVLLKRLAVRAGLGQYGRNNLCYVDEMGSFVKLFAYFTDFQFEDDSWNEAKMMDSCTNCSICLKECPTGAITGDNFVINVDRCIPLYNEIRGEFPDWLDASSHNALMGCLKCQLCCPANSRAIAKTERLDHVSEEETDMILEGSLNEKLLHSISAKLRMFSPEDAPYYFPVIRRNLQALVS
ncbi:MAG: epoxyqueuosine reductase [Candidatus Thorarchaeota archaeon]|nr:epoxyqueuosine reductase [Candidatus Thorarchaeota archaeon]